MKKVYKSLEIEIFNLFIQDVLAVSNITEKDGDGLAIELDPVWGNI